MSSKTNSLVRRTDLPWGEDVHAEIVRRRSSGEPCEELSERAVADYMMAVRQRSVEDPAVHQALAESTPSPESHARLCSLMRDVPVSGTGDLFEAAVQNLLEELERQRSMPPSAYLVDPRTGRSVIPIGPDLVYTPPDYVGEDGRLHKARPIVHPSVSSALVLATAEASRRAEIERRASDPVTGHAYRHLTDPDRVAELARLRLRHVGVRLPDALEADEETIEFGRESVEADLQAVNARYHRLSTYAAALAKRVLDRCGPGGAAWIGPVTVSRNSKQRWFSAPVRTIRTEQVQ